MAVWDIGDVVPLTVTVKDSTGTAANATAVTCTVVAPDGTSTTPTVSNTATGVYTASVTPTQTGRYAYVFTATGTNASAYSDVFVVSPNTAAVGLADVKDHLNITGTTTDEELRRFTAAATSACEQYLGRNLTRATVVDTFTRLHGNGRVLVLSSMDVASITTITQDGTALASTGYVADLTAGVVTLYDGGPWTVPVVVTYVRAGVTMTADLTLAVLELVRHLWETQRGSMPMMPRADEYMTPGTGYSLPNRVKELLDPYRVSV